MTTLIKFLHLLERLEAIRDCVRYLSLSVLETALWYITCVYTVSLMAHYSSLFDPTTTILNMMFLVALFALLEAIVVDY
jgi:hypothetical protein